MLPLQVLYSKFGFMYNEVNVAGQDFILIREEDVIGVMPRSGEPSKCGASNPRGSASAGVEQSRGVRCKAGAGRREEGFAQPNAISARLSHSGVRGRGASTASVGALR